MVLKRIKEIGKYSVSPQNFIVFHLEKTRFCFAGSPFFSVELRNRLPFQYDIAHTFYVFTMGPTNYLNTLPI